MQYEKRNEEFHHCILTAIFISVEGTRPWQGCGFGLPTYQYRGVAYLSPFPIAEINKIKTLHFLC
jgi:hypothetical protein